MKRVYVVHKKSIYLFLLIGVAMIALIPINHFSKAMNISYDQKLEEIKTTSFVKSVFCLNNSLEYICNTNYDASLEGINQEGYFTYFTFPIIGYFRSSSQSTLASVKEIYPNLTSQEPEEEDMSIAQVFAPDIVDIPKTVETVQASSFVVNTGNYTLEQLTNYNFIINNIYNIDPSIMTSEDDFDVNYFLNYDTSVDISSEEPKILVYHTHSQESFVDSVSGEKSDTVVGVGDQFVDILENDYGISVYHLREEFDIVDGVLDRSKAYELIQVRLEEILEEYPSIEVMIDLHRDGIPDDVRLVTTIDEQETAKIMFFNGLCKTMKDGVMQPLESISNPYVKENMAFSFQMFLKANELYPSITRKIYIRGYRYNLHMRAKSMLVEVGAQTNTVQEAKNAMEPLAEILYEVITNQ